MKHVLRSFLLVAAAATLAGCPLQTPTFEVVSTTGGLLISASASAPLVGDTITLTASPAVGAVDLATATWTTSDVTILSLASAHGASVMATAHKAGIATVTVTVGTRRGFVTITALDDVGDVTLHGPASLAVGGEATYTAAATDTAGLKLTSTPTWVVSGGVALATPGANTGTSMLIRGVSAGAGDVTVQVGGRSAHIAVTVSALRGHLVITRADGSPVPASAPVGDPLTLAASYDASGEPASDAQWKATGPCLLLGGSGATVSVEQTGAGTCTLAASAMGMDATATYDVVAVTGIMIVGDTSPLKLGESRTLMAVGVAGALQTGAVTVSWGTPDGQVLTLAPASNSVSVTGAAVGTTTLVALAAGKAMGSVDITVVPSSLVLSASGTHVLAGAGAQVTVAAQNPKNVAGRFASAADVMIVGAGGFGTVSTGVLQGDGTVTFALANAQASSPSVTASFHGVVSNALSFTLAQVASVVVMGPVGPVRVGGGVDFRAIVLDASGARIDGDLVATWADSTGVYMFPADGVGLTVTGNAVKLGTAAIVATVAGVASPPYASPVQPASIGLSAFSPSSIAVGGTATVAVTVLDSAGAPIPGVPLSQVSVMASDGTKISLDAGTLMGGAFVFTATGLAATGPGGVMVTATWTDGMYPVSSGAVPLIVTGP
jgi:hypothetical protein